MTENTQRTNPMQEIFVLDTYLEQPLDASRQNDITNNLIETLLKELKMQKNGPIRIYGATDLRAPGWSFIQPMLASHISGHYFEKPGKLPHIRMDLYSCNKFDWKTFVKIINQHLQMNVWRATLIVRNLNEEKRTISEFSGTKDQSIDKVLTSTIESMAGKSNKNHPIPTVV